MTLRVPRSALVLAAAISLLRPAPTRNAERGTGNAFLPALPGYSYEFPRDHGSHEEFQTEWWYYTGHLRGASGRRYGFEVTFFRVGVDPATSVPESEWDLRHLGLAHFAITDLSRREFRYYEKLNRATRFTARALAGTLHVFNEGWRVTTLGDGSFRLQAAAGGDAVDLVMRSRKPPAVHGENGVSVKAEGIGYASHYYSLTRLEVEGVVTSRGKRERADGTAWMDHEFGSSVLREHQAGWDWFSIQLDNETELMLYVIRRKDGTPDTTSSGSIVNEDGEVIHLRRDQFSVAPLGRWTSKKSGATYPMGWKITIPAFQVSLTLRETMRDQELITRGSTRVTYWEGAVDVTGNFAAVGARGVGYVEMTGYARTNEE